ncbi:MAG: YbhN family protein [Oscillospiraceae bacterium]
MDKKRWKTVLVSVTTLLLLFLLVAWVFRGQYREIVQNIRAVGAGDLLLLLNTGLVYQLLEAAVCRALIRRHLPAFSFRQATEVTFLGVFGNVSTLSVGSVPMQSYYLHRCGLMVGSGVGTMTLEYVFHKSTILLYTTVLLLCQGRWLGDTGRGLARYLLLGYGICALIIAALLLLCTWEKVQRLALWLVDRLPDTGKWEGRKRLWRTNLTALYAESRHLLRDRRRLCKVLALNVLKLLCLYSVPFLCMRMLGIAGPSFWHTQLLTALMHLISNALPNVAGMGPVELAFVMIFSHYIEYAQASSALLLYRVATFFFPFLLSILVFLRVQKRMLNDARED